MTNREGIEIDDSDIERYGRNDVEREVDLHCDIRRNETDGNEDKTAVIEETTGRQRRRGRPQGATLAN